jgi:hypothetical protein
VNNTVFGENVNAAEEKKDTFLKSGVFSGF